MSRGRPTPNLVHVAGERSGWLQHCIGCGTLLTDNTRWNGGLVEVTGDDDPAEGPQWWPAGAQVATEQGAPGARVTMYLVGMGDVPLDELEQPCVSP